MDLKNIFKKKKESSKKEEKEDKKKTVKKTVKKTTPKKIVKTKKTTFEGFAYRILKFPHITEKATILLQNNQYVFVVYNNVNKIEIRKAIESLYGVKVLKVRIIKVPKKRRRVGRAFGWKKGYKKAIVRIKEGQKIEEMIR